MDLCHFGILAEGDNSQPMLASTSPPDTPACESTFWGEWCWQGYFICRALDIIMQTA